MKHTKLRDVLSYALREAHRDLAIADGHSYQSDFGDPRAVEIALYCLAAELKHKTHTHAEPSSAKEDAFNEGVLYAAEVLSGKKPCSFD